VLVVPGGHAETHLVGFVAAAQLSVGVVVEALVDVSPGLEVEVELVSDVLQVAGHISELISIYAKMMAIRMTMWMLAL
jgi:hypothetical protein